MKETPNAWDFQEDKNLLNVKDGLLRYWFYWPWFVMSVVICASLGFLYAHYTPDVYESFAKIKILKEADQLNVVSERVSIGDRVSMDNQIESLKSYRLLSDVVRKLNLDVSYYQKETLKTTEVWEVPFKISRRYIEDTLSTARSYDITINSDGFRIVDDKGIKHSILKYHNQNTLTTELPFKIMMAEAGMDDLEINEYKLVFNPIKATVLELSKILDVSAADAKTSDIITLKLAGQSKEKSEAILNAVIVNFEQDGVKDKQLVSKQTLEVIDKRFGYLSGELDSIEVGKQSFKQRNRLSYIEADASLSLQKKSMVEDQVFELGTQISLAKLLKDKVIEEAKYNTLPAEMGLQNQTLNAMVFEYNKLALERNKLLPNVASNHPTLVDLSGQLERGKTNILKAVNNYEAGLKKSASQLEREQNIASARFSRIPEKEKKLRSIERQQGIKENLYMLLLQKREEAAINLAATIPSIKVIDYAVTPIKPISPKKAVVYPLSLFLGMFFPFIVLFTRFSLDNKVHDKAAIEKLIPEVPIVGEIPVLNGGKTFENDNDRSALGESFRILSTNVNYLLPEKGKGQGKVVYVTSSIKNEGKSLVALNLSLAFASMEKRVLLVGADLRNPQLHAHFEADRSTAGLSDYLMNPELKFKDCLHEGFGKNAFHEVYLGGAIFSNAPVLLAGKRFETFMNEARREYDYVIVDTAPTLLVTDTLLISKYSDLTLFVVRAGHTDLHLLEFSKNLVKTKRLRNMAYVFNGVGHGNSKAVNYGYGYGYEPQKPTKTRNKFRLKKMKM